MRWLEVAYGFGSMVLAAFLLAMTKRRAYQAGRRDGLLLRELVESDMTATHSKELWWWRHFATKFVPESRPGALPRVGDMLLGSQFLLYVVPPREGDPVPYTTHRTRAGLQR